tara:strand:- start:165 stop:377 length:213 start_codon:yes stop_codon:yes gene_type:complete
MGEWSIFETCVTALMAGLAFALRLLFNRSEDFERRMTSQETRLAVVNERTIEIFHRLERIEAKLDKLLSK